MRIAILNRTFSRAGGGAESYSVALVAELAQRHDIHVFSQETDEPVPGVTYHRVLCISPKPRWLNQWLFAGLTWWKTRSGFDVVHSHENTWHGQIQTIHVRTVHYNLFHARKGLSKLLRWLKVLTSPRLMTYVFLESRRFRDAPRRCIVAASEILKNECRSLFSSSVSAQWATIAPGTFLPDMPRDAGHCRQLLGLPADLPVVLFVANDYARKGLETLLAALQLMNNTVHLVVVGHEGQKARFKTLSDQMGLAHRVHYLGSLKDLTPAYCAADVLAHPTREDSYGMVVLEAMAHRLPVVVSNAEYCGISHELSNRENAFLLNDPFDAKALAGVLGDVLFSSSAPLIALKERAFDFAKHHSWGAAALRYEVLYRQVLARDKT